MDLTSGEHDIIQGADKFNDPEKEILVLDPSHEWYNSVLAMIPVSSSDSPTLVEDVSFPCNVLSFNDI